VPAASDVLGYAAAAPLTGSASEILVRVGVDSTPDFDFDFAVIVLCWRLAGPVVAPDFCAPRRA
jgi:hypothetical protein